MVAPKVESEGLKVLEMDGAVQCQASLVESVGAHQHRRSSSNPRQPGSIFQSSNTENTKGAQLAYELVQGALVGGC